MCVDDEKSVLDTLIRELTTTLGGKYHYETAESVDEAWEVIDMMVQDGFEMVLVISDWLMPGKKGDVFLVELHRNFPNTVKILLTGQADAGAIENAMRNADLYAFMQKPWKKDQLVSLIQTAFARI